MQRRAPKVLVLTLLALGFLPATAGAFDLSGAWASDPDQCKKLYNNKGGSIRFSEMSDLYGSGFIVEGNKIRGKTARCTIKSSKEDGDTLTLLASCATDIMLSNIPFNLKIVNQDAVTRLFPGMSDIQMNYHRCQK